MNVIFQQIQDLKLYFNAFKHRIYCSDKSTDWKSDDVNQPKIYKRVSKNAQGHLQFHRHADEPTDDLSGRFYRPRIELVPIYARLPKHQLLHIQYVVSAVEGLNDFRGIIFQIMDHTPQGDTLPVFQFEIRKGFLHTRWCEVKPDGSSGGTSIKRIAHPKWGDGDATEWHTLDVYTRLSPNDDGFFRVYRNRKLVWERHARNASSNTLDPQIQYGIYADKGVSLKTQVKSLLWEKVDTVPLTENL